MGWGVQVRDKLMCYGVCCKDYDTLAEEQRKNYDSATEAEKKSLDKIKERTLWMEDCEGDSDEQQRFGYSYNTAKYSFN